MSDTVVVAVIPSEGCADALAFAADLARPSAAHVLAAGVAVVPVMAEREIFAAAQRGALERELSLMLQASPSDADPVPVVVTSSSVSRGLHEIAEEHDAMVLVVGPSRRGPVDRTFRGDPTLAIVHGSRCPVAVAPRGYADRPAGAAWTIGVAVDGAEETEHVLEHAVALAQAHGVGLEIVHVAETLRGYAMPPWMDVVSGGRYVAAVQAEARAVLQRATETVGGRVPVRTAVLEGSPAVALPGFGDDVDVLVVGSRAHGAVGRVLLGTTAGHVLHGAGCGVVIVPQHVATRALHPA
jgi:nucleotide-binding universal stress UspA family protein